MMTRRLLQLFAGLGLYGFSMALMIRADLGLDPWDVFHQGLAQRLPLSFGMVVCLVGAVVLLLWIPLRQKPGFGALANIVVIGMAADASLAILPQLHALPLRAAMLVLSILLGAVAGGAYIGAGLGPGPRDGLMTGLTARTGWPLRRVRTGIEVTILAAGWLLGGTVGVGTVLYALTIGPLLQIFLPLMTVKARASSQPLAATP